MKTKVEPEMRVVHACTGLGGTTPVQSPTGRYKVTVRKTKQVICITSNEIVAEALATLIDKNADEWNRLVENT